MDALALSCILYLGDDSVGSTSGHRVAALRRLGYNVIVVDVRRLASLGSKIWQWINYRTGYRLIQRALLCNLSVSLESLQLHVDMVWIDNGELIGREILQWLKSKLQVPVVLFSVDDPTGPRDWNRFASARSALYHYHLCVCVRPETELEMLALGAVRVLRVWRSYDERLHSAQEKQEQVQAIVSFVGTNIPRENRDSFLFSLLGNGVPLSIHGSSWHRSPYWQHLQACYSARTLRDRSYSSQLAMVALSLGFLSHGNRDLHTSRSAEVPAAGGVLFAERSSEHQLLYEEGVEALFWDSTEECASVAKNALVNPAILSAVRKAGHERVVAAGMGNEDICQHVLALL